jgi:ATP-dependent DNA helicase RecG
MNEKLQMNVQYVKGVGEKRAAKLRKLGVETVEDLLYLLPRRYIDYSAPQPIAFAPYDENCAVCGTVLSVSGGTRISKGRTIYKVTVADDSGKMTVTFFNSEYTVKKLTVGKDFLFWGKLSGSMLGRSMTSPLFIPADSPLTMEGIYPLTAGLTARQVANIIKNAFDLVGEIPDTMPTEIIKEYSLMPLENALKAVHFPQSNSQLKKGIERLAFDELFYLQMGMGILNAAAKKESNINIENIDIGPFLRSFPFTPTNAQNKAIRDILQDFLGRYSMNRLLQGDVGSGKTLVAMAAMYCMFLNGYQSCIMAPTEILAVQHYKNMKKSLGALGVNVGCLTASVKGKERRDILKKLKEGKIDVLVGTHALLGEKVEFSHLGLCITDEQHRFGVKQRNLISLKGDNPHILAMSATPIPRTLAMIIYAGMEISVIDEMPMGRQKTKTYFVDSSYRKRIFAFIDKNIKKGHQTYIVLPAIEDNENIVEMQSVNTYYKNVARPFLPDANIALLHGKMKPAEKEKVMADFAKGNADVLCSTTVVEVGVDVPNATIMLIENAERYGLSALHQLRGRVGRGNAESYCILISDNKNPDVQRRLRFLTENSSGFAVSQYDLEHRGPGDFFGSAQHGLPSLKTANLINDIKTVEISRKAAEKIAKESPDLKKYPAIRRKCEKMFVNVTL